MLASPRCGPCTPYPHPPLPQVYHCQPPQTPQFGPHLFNVRCNPFFHPYQSPLPAQGLSNTACSSTSCSIEVPLASDRTVILHLKPTPPPKASDVYVTAASTLDRQTTRQIASTTVRYVETSPQSATIHSTAVPSKGATTKSILAVVINSPAIDTYYLTPPPSSDGQDRTHINDLRMKSGWHVDKHHDSYSIYSDQVILNSFLQL